VRIDSNDYSIHPGVIGRRIGGSWIHLAVATYATAGVAVVVQVLRRRLDQVIASERSLATTDALTRAMNRRGLTARAAVLVEEAAERGVSIGALVADLDRFTDVNDRYGHAEGDRVLVRPRAQSGSVCLVEAPSAGWAGGVRFHQHLHRPS
jgi:PleD family two-component response regulator